MQSIASSHGADILRSFLYKTNTYHGNPPAFPPFSDRVRQLSPVYHDLDINEPSRPKPQSQNGADEGDEDDQDAMLESIAETFESAGSRYNVDADEMFMQLLEQMDSPLGQVWLDGVSVSGMDSGRLPAYRYISSHAHLRPRPSPSRHSSLPTAYHHEQSHVITQAPPEQATA